MNVLAHDIDCTEQETDYITVGCSTYCDYQKAAIAEASKFRFIGHDGSMGYRTGQIYSLHIRWHMPQPGLSINRAGWKIVYGLGSCPYSDTAKFLENWEIA